MACRILTQRFLGSTGNQEIRALAIKSQLSKVRAW
jgi:hypothetical protein